MEELRKPITEEVIETFLNGHDPQERIVNIEYNYKDSFIKDLMHVYHYVKVIELH